MARRKGNMFSGILGPIVLRIVGGEQIASTRVEKGKMKKTSGMIKASETFGLGSKLGGKIRLCFKSYTKQFTDTANASRLSAIMSALLRQARDENDGLFSFDEHSFDSLSDYDFNNQSPLKKWLLVQPEINFDEGRIKISLPRVKLRTALKFPARAAVCNLTMVVTFFRLEDGYRLAAPLTHELTLLKDQLMFEDLDFSFPVPDGCLCILGFFLTYLSSGGPYGVELNNKKFNPAGIVSAILTPGTFVEDESLGWFPMIDLKFPSSETSS
jgi:hypothetical protein